MRRGPGDDRGAGLDAASRALLLVACGAAMAATLALAPPAAVPFLVAALLAVPALVARQARRVARRADADRLALVRALTSALDAGSPFSRGHGYRVSRLALRLAGKLGLTEREKTELEFGALLHDLGRTAIHHDVLLKAGRLDAAEQAQMQTHPRVGYEILADIGFLRGAARLVLTHHEQPDGRGYPQGLRGEAIPAGARIIGVAAAFDALTVDRPYRRGLPVAEALEEIERHSGTQFFPEVVRALLELHAEGALVPDTGAEELALGTNNWGDPARRSA